MVRLPVGCVEYSTTHRHSWNGASDNPDDGPVTGFHGMVRRRVLDAPHELRTEGRRQGCHLVGIDNQVFELELHVAAAVPFVNAGVEHDRAGGVRGELPGLLGHVPADGLDLRIALNHAELEVVLGARRRFAVRP